MRPCASIDLPLYQVDVVIHRQSIVHSLVEFRDGAVLAQLGTPDMRLPIRYALTYPDRAENPARSPWICLTCPPLTFAPPDREAFPCLAAGGGGCSGGRHRLRGAQRRQRGGGGACFCRTRSAFYDIPTPGGRGQSRGAGGGKIPTWRTFWRRTAAARRGRAGLKCLDEVFA